MKKSMVLFVAVFCVVAWGIVNSFASTYTKYGGYQPPDCCPSESWNGIDPNPKPVNPPGFVKRIGKWNVMVKAGTPATAQIWWGEDGGVKTVIYKLIFPSRQAANNWIKCKTPSISKIEVAIENWTWTTPTIGLRHKWMPLNNVP